MVRIQEGVVRYGCCKSVIQNGRERRRKSGCGLQKALHEPSYRDTYKAYWLNYTYLLSFVLGELYVCMFVADYVNYVLANCKHLRLSF